jgi:hypothetical protein
MKKILVVFALLVVGTASSAAAQFNVPPQRQPLNLSGPRFGLTVVTGSAVQRLRDEVGIAPVFTQFGWQFERGYQFEESGLTAVSEWVLLAGGLEQGTLLPSISWLVGMRSAGGTEFGVGPNLSAAGVGLAIAGGVTTRFGELNIPINFAVVPSASGMRMSMLTGFNSAGLRM